MNTVFYRIKGLSPNYEPQKGLKSLPKNLFNHITEKYGEIPPCEVVFCYELLVEALPNLCEQITFVNGKPTAENFSLSLSHTKGGALICYCLDNKVSIGGDLQLVTSPPKMVAKVLDANEDNFFIKWSQNEATFKANNILNGLSMLKRIKSNLNDFKGESGIVNINKQRYSYAVYSGGLQTKHI